MSTARKSRILIYSPFDTFPSIELIVGSIVRYLVDYNFTSIDTELGLVDHTELSLRTSRDDRFDFDVVILVFPEALENTAKGKFELKEFITFYLAFFMGKISSGSEDKLFLLFAEGTEELLPNGLRNTIFYKTYNQTKADANLLTNIGAFCKEIIKRLDLGLDSVNAQAAESQFDELEEAIPNSTQALGGRRVLLKKAKNALAEGELKDALNYIQAYLDKHGYNSSFEERLTALQSRHNIILYANRDGKIQFDSYLTYTNQIISSTIALLADINNTLK